MTRSRAWRWAPLLLAACEPSGPSPEPSSAPNPGSLGQVHLDQILGPVTRATKGLPAISGGTLAVGQRDGKPVAVAADPEHDRVWMVDHAGAADRVDLPSGAEPGRVAIAGGQAFVALRRRGQVAVIGLKSNQLTSQVAVCAAPRGLAVDEASDTLAVACASGELVLLRASTMAMEASYNLGLDLRDVVLRGDEIVLTRFRSAEVMVLRRQDGTLIDQGAPAPSSSKSARWMPASVAWRMVASPDGHPVVLHQRHVIDEIPTAQPGGYGSSVCGAVVQTALSQVGGGAIRSTAGLSAGLAVDVAVRRDGAVVVAAPQTRLPSSLDRVPMAKGKSAAKGDAGEAGTSGSSAKDAAGSGGSEAATSTKGEALKGYTGDSTAWTCGKVATRPFGLDDGAAPDARPAQIDAPTVVNAVAVAFDGDDHLVMQLRAPGGLWWDGQFTAFGDDDEVADTGHRIFHMSASSGLACASCHPEGGEDGRTWNFADTGPRRTQALQGGLRGSEPFHWSGDAPDITTLMTTVFTGRMSGGIATPAQADALLGWLDQVPLVPPPAPADGSAIARGKDLYESLDVGCIDCHQGPRLALTTSFDVGTGEALQVPSLHGVVYRAPFLHDGRAATMLDRFGPGGGGDEHGHTSQLSSSQVSDLIAYLSSL